jgi:hypothetical protein
VCVNEKRKEWVYVNEKNKKKSVRVWKKKGVEKEMSMCVCARLHVLCLHILCSFY